LFEPIDYIKAIIGGNQCLSRNRGEGVSLTNGVSYYHKSPAGVASTQELVFVDKS
jgi:hypothetical protein